MEIQMQSVVSSNISAVGFDKATGTLRVKFATGETYDATGTTQTDFDEFMLSKSKGQHFNKVLKKAFVWTKIEKRG